MKGNICSQCGKPFSDHACGPTHAAVFKMIQSDICIICLKPITIQIMKNTGVCSEFCRKERDGDAGTPMALANS